MKKCVFPIVGVLIYANMGLVKMAHNAGCVKIPVALPAVFNFVTPIEHMNEG